MTEALPPLPPSVSRSLPSYAAALKAIGSLKTQITNISSDLTRMRRAPLADAARMFVCLHRLNAEIEALEKSYSGMFEEIKTQTLPDIIENEGQTSVPLADGFRITVSSKVYAGIKAGMKDAAYKWLQKNGLGDLITETVNASTLSAAAKVRLEEECLELPDGFFNTTIQQNTSVTRTKK